MPRGWRRKPSKMSSAGLTQTETNAKISSEKVGFFSILGISFMYCHFATQGCTMK